MTTLKKFNIWSLNVHELVDFNNPDSYFDTGGGHAYVSANLYVYKVAYVLM